MRFECSKPPVDLPTVACQCQFCRRHGLLMTVEKDGQIEIRSDARHLRRYQFATRTADFVFCGHCGTMMAQIATRETPPPNREKQMVGIVNVNVLYEREAFLGREIAVTPNPQEGEGERLQRRFLLWGGASIHV